MLLQKVANFVLFRIKNVIIVVLCLPVVESVVVVGIVVVGATVD